MPLRLRLLISVIVLVFAGLAVSDVVTYTSLRNYLVSRVDQQLESEWQLVAHEILEPGNPFRGPGGPQSSVPPGTFGELLDSNGAIVGQPVVFGVSDAPGPKLPAGLQTRGAPQFFTTGAANGSSLRYRVYVEHGALQGPFSTEAATVVVAVPLSELGHTLRRLLVVEALVTGLVLLGLGFLSWWLVRRGLRPLEEIGSTAGAIAAGDLSRRIPDEDPRTEVGRLGLALNAMLAQIEEAFAERKASEDRLRRFLADASHELRTPLTSIRGYAELFRRGASQREGDLTKSMRRIEDESARMGVLVEDLLLLARLDQDRPLQMAPVDLAALASDAVQDARAASPDRQITLDAPAPVMVEGDEARLRQVAANLLANAADHTPAGTPVTVRAAAEDGGAVLQVADRGPGLTPDEAERAFEPFYRADPSRDRSTGGVGLGLAIVAAIAAAHRGSVKVEPTPGGGATFKVLLPRRNGDRPD